ncbi:Uncharacterized protein FWK35_00030443, partial [Aphis craccivora]
ILSGAMNVLILQCCVFFFFVSVYTRTCRNNASISNFGVVSNRKTNLVNRLRRSFFEFSNSFQKRREKPKKKLRKNGNFYAKPVFDQIDFFIIWFVDKKIVPYDLYNFYEICRKRENLQRNDNDLSSNDFKYVLLFKKYLKILPLIKIRFIRNNFNHASFETIETIVEWKEANIRGNYHYLNPTFYDKGNYHIKLENLKYQASSTLTANTMKYPSSVPSSSISYTSVKASFSGKIPTVTNIDDSHNLKKLFFVTYMFHYKIR